MSLRMPDLRTLPIDRFCNFIWWWMTRDATNAQAVEKTRAALWRPPPAAAKKPIDPRSPWAPEAEQAGFSALKAAFGGKAAQSVPKDPVWPQVPPGNRRIPIPHKP